MLRSKLNIEQYLDGSDKSKELLYRHFAPKMYGICLRFAGNKMDADDILQEGFIKIFSKLKDFRNEGSFEGWIRRTFINTAINFYRRSIRNSRFDDIESLEFADNRNESVYDTLSKEELAELLHELPNGYRTVFNLNVIEGYTHKEIGQMLDISDNTSKSQLTRARAILQKKVEKLMLEKVKIPYEGLKVVKGKKEKKLENVQYLQAV